MVIRIKAMHEVSGTCHVRNLLLREMLLLIVFQFIPLSVLYSSLPVVLLYELFHLTMPFAPALKLSTDEGVIN